jgi:MFS family permease
MTAEWLAFWTATALAGLLATAVLLTLTNNWRASLLALGAQYLFAAGLLALVVIWQIAAVLALVGLLVVLILLLASRQASFGQAATALPEAAASRRVRFARLRRIEFQTNLPFRLVAVALAAVAVGTVISQPGETLPGLPDSLALAGVWLIGLGVLNLGFTDEPMNAGMALLTTLTGVTLLYAPVEPARTVVVLLAAVNLGVALSVGYLTSLRYGEAGGDGGA